VTVTVTPGRQAQVRSYWYTDTQTTDGLALSGLMVRYNIGVQDQRTYVIKRVDEDFFDEN
jgi:restriction endonuclease Mrr